MRSPLYSTLLGAMLLVCLAGCAGVGATAIYYLPATTETFPPKAKDAPVPLLVDPPARAFQTIGRFQMESPRGWRFVRRALEYNARANGADAVLLHQNKTFRETILTDFPPTVEMVPFTRVVYVQRKGKNRGTEAVPVVDYWPVFRPGYTSESIRTWIGVDAEMLRFKER